MMFSILVLRQGPHGTWRLFYLRMGEGARGFVMLCIVWHVIHTYIICNKTQRKATYQMRHLSPFTIRQQESVPNSTSMSLRPKSNMWCNILASRSIKSHQCYTVDHLFDMWLFVYMKVATKQKILLFLDLWVQNEDTYHQWSGRKD